MTILSFMLGYALVGLATAIAAFLVIGALAGLVEVAWLLAFGVAVVRMAAAERTARRDEGRRIPVARTVRR